MSKAPSPCDELATHPGVETAFTHMCNHPTKEIKWSKRCGKRWKIWPVPILVWSWWWPLAFALPFHDIIQHKQRILCCITIRAWWEDLSSQLKEQATKKLSKKRVLIAHWLPSFLNGRSLENPGLLQEPEGQMALQQEVSPNRKWSPGWFPQGSNPTHPQSQWIRDQEIGQTKARQAAGRDKDTGRAAQSGSSNKLAKRV